MASQDTVVPEANEIADESGRPRIFVMLERLLLAVSYHSALSVYHGSNVFRFRQNRNLLLASTPAGKCFASVSSETVCGR